LDEDQVVIHENYQLNREIDHVNMVKLREVILEDKSIYMIFEYAEHDFLVSVSVTWHCAASSQSS
jgi:hypothetical protein